MKVSLIITTYNRPDALRLVLQSALKQELLPDDIVIADDGSSSTTRDVIEELRKESPVPILHAWQEDRGFRAAMARNRAIAMSSGEYLILIDGDMILHPLFIRDHLDMAEQSCFVQGSRVLLTPEATRRALKTSKISFSFFSPFIRNRKNALRSRLLSHLFTRKSSSLKGIRTCNFALFRDDLLSINGFDNRFVGWGREDSELAARLLNKGVMKKNVKFTAIAYHLYHRERERASLEENDRRLSKTINTQRIKCSDGIERFFKTHNR
jgi:glycosyltransferase involved in cell wall biosynthesis